ncbi:hypothetical protein [Streptomyces sp. SM12]|uniref:hypothetical protein n=1 Tax=Streptomyces sp. SM12 TaxID=1071602 RepID=UPI0011B03E82|nr:hypothetical protein [Streptomyces sp. SM12]
MAQRPLAELTREARALVVESMTLGRTLERTQRISMCLVGIRLQLSTPDGEPDIRGNSGPYREIAGQIFYPKAEWGKRDLRNFQAAVRRAVSATLREVMAPEQLAAHGLKTRSVQDTQAAAKAVTWRIGAALRGSPTSGQLDHAPIELLKAALLLIQDVTPAVVEALPTADRDQVRALAEAVEDHAFNLRQAVTPDDADDD